MRIVPDKLHPALARARLRRRVFLSLFAVFLTASVLGLVLVGLHAAKTRPAPDGRGIARATGAVAAWHLHVPTQLGPFLERQLGHAETARLTARIEALRPMLHETATLVYLPGPEPRPVLCLTVRRPQRLALDKLRSLLGEILAACPGNWQAHVSPSVILIAPDSSGIGSIPRSSWTARGSDPLRLSAANPVLYEGPVALLPVAAREALPESARQTEEPILLEWLRGSPARLTFGSAGAPMDLDPAPSLPDFLMPASMRAPRGGS